jgi:hypothetical protein
MKDIIIVYHAYMHGDHYMDMMAEQMRLIISSGLYSNCSKLYIGVVESKSRKPINGKEWITQFWDGTSSKGNGSIPSKVEIVFYKENKEETETLQWLSSYAKTNPNKYVLYFHTKGITHYTTETESWRAYMEYFCIERWSDCVLKLEEGYDCCGTRWHTKTVFGEYPHFSGGFWWANTNYLKTLNDDYFTKDLRYFREFWIGSSDKVNAYCIHDNKINPYKEACKKESYRTNKDSVIHVICTSYERPIPLRILIDCFMTQTSDRWMLHIVHDGKAPKSIKDIVSSYDDSRISFKETSSRREKWGHPNRRDALNEILCRSDDYILITNDDNYYVPTFVEKMLSSVDVVTGMVVCDMLHSYLGYAPMQSHIRENAIDMGSFIVRADIAKKVGFAHDHFSADGRYAVDCFTYIKKNNYTAKFHRNPLFVHN